MSTNCAEPGKGGRLSWYSFSKDLGEMKPVFFVRELEKGWGWSGSLRREEATSKEVVLSLKVESACFRGCQGDECIWTQPRVVDIAELNIPARRHVDRDNRQLGLA